MERSSKHGPRVDEQMSQEVLGTVQGIAGSRAEEWREPEPAGEDQPNPTAAPTGETGDVRTGSPRGMTPRDVEQRSRLGRYISLSVLPGDRETLLRNAEENAAPADVIDQLARLPSGTEFRTVSEVWATLGHTNEPQRW